jgi:hypothetical protein
MIKKDYPQYKLPYNKSSLEVNLRSQSANQIYRPARSTGWRGLLADEVYRLAKSIGEPESIPAAYPSYSISELLLA